VSVSTRTRFEVLKRDGFRCRYCGASPVGDPLHVDHVVPQSRGGSDDIENLVASCQQCNLGKSDVPLETTSPPPASAESMREHALQVAEYLDAQKELTEARARVVEWLEDQWVAEVGRTPGPRIKARLRTASFNHDLGMIVDAIAATAGGCQSVDGLLPYFNTCLRNMRESL
jgi:hypothetical protein